MADEPREAGLRNSVRRAVDGAFDATVGRVGHSVTEVAMDVTGATAQQVIEDLEPYLIDETIPRIVDGVTPRLVADLLPALLEDLRPYLEAELVPRIVDGLVPYIQDHVAPELIDGLMPKIKDEVAPELIEALMPRIRDRIAPDLLDALMPRIRDEVAPQLVDALMPKIRDEVAPQLVDALMPKIRAEVVPLILDDIVDDPRVRDLIREQSQGLFLDALESVRENLADVDVLVERFGRHLLRRPARPQAESAIDLVLDGSGDADTTPARLTRANLAEQRNAWRDMPVTPAPPGREFSHAGVVTRLVAFAVDVTLVGWLVSQGLSALVNLLDSLFTPVPEWLVVALTAIAASFVPIYLGVSWWLTGRSLGSWIVGTRVCTPDGRNPGLIRALVRSWVGVLGVVIWILTGAFSLFDPKRRSWLDRLLHTEVRYVVPLDQQRRYIREALQERQERAQAANPPSDPDAVAPEGP